MIVLFEIKIRKKELRPDSNRVENLEFRINQSRVSSHLRREIVNELTVAK